MRPVFLSEVQSLVTNFDDRTFSAAKRVRYMCISTCSDYTSNKKVFTAKSRKRQETRYLETKYYKFTSSFRIETHGMRIQSAYIVSHERKTESQNEFTKAILSSCSETQDKSSIALTL